MAGPQKGHTATPPGGPKAGGPKAGGPKAGGPKAGGAESRSSSGDAAQAFAVALREATLRLVRHEPVVAADRDPEGVHQQRVAARRLRAQLKVFAPLVEARWAQGLRRELSWFDRRLAAVRDIDVVMERLRREPSPAATVVLGALGERRRGAVADLFGALGSPRYRRLRRSLDKAVAAPPFLAKAAGSRRQAGDWLAREVARRWERLDGAVATWQKTGDDAALHQVRIDARRGRYVCDAAAPVLGTPTATLARRLAAIQDVLGEAHDALVAAGWAEEVAAASGASVGEEVKAIAAEQRAAATAVLDHWPAAWRRATAAAAGKPWKPG